MGITGSGERRGAGGFTVYLFSRRGLLFAAGVFLLVLSVLLFSRRALNDYAADIQAAEAVVAAQAVLDAELQGASALASHISALLTKKSLSAATEVSAFVGAFRPKGCVFFYSEQGVPALTGGGAAFGLLNALDPGLFKLVEKALRGLPASGRVEANGQMYCAAAVQAGNEAVKAIAVVTPVFSQRPASVNGRVRAYTFLILKDAAGSPHLFGAPADAPAVDAKALYAAAIKRGGRGVIPISSNGVTYRVGVALLHDDKGAAPVYVGALPAEPPPTFFSAPVLASFALAWVFLVLLAAYVFYQRERLFLSSMAKALTDLSEQGVVEPDLDRSAPVQQALDRVAAALHSERSAAEQRAVERDTALRRLEDKGLLWPAEKLDAIFRFFFENSIQGIFLIREDGLFLRINQSFANLIRYDSPTMLLNDRPSFAALFPYAGEGVSLLDNLKNHPYRPFIVPLRLRDGKIRNFTVTGIRTGMEEDDGLRTIAGFIADRVVEEQNVLLQQQYEQIRRENEGIALLLAVTCLRAQMCLSAGRKPRQAVKVSVTEEDPSERRASPDRPVEELFGESPGSSASVLRHIDMPSLDPAEAQRLIFEDVYRLAVAEAEHIPPVMAPMHLLRILDDVCTQIGPMLRERGTALFCEVEKNLPFVMDGPAVLLRHALFRAVSSMVSPMQGGSAFLSVARAPNAPQNETAPRLLFSVSWVDPADAPVVPVRETEDQEALSPGTLHADEPGPFSLRDERELLLFLLEKMNGELLEGKIGATTRSVQFVARFDAFTAVDGGEMKSGVTLPSHSMAAAVRNTEYIFQGTDYTGAQRLDFRPESTAETAGPVSPFAESAGNEQLVLEAAADVFPAGEGQESDDGASLKLLVMEEELAEREQAQAAAADDSLDILLVDDSSNNRLLFSYFLRKTHHRLIEAYDGRQGIDILRNRQFDVIFMDMEMPLLNGYQATRIIRAMESDLGRSPAPVVALTAHVLPDVKYQCSLAGCTEFLPKPLNKNALLTMLDAFARMKEDRQTDLS